MLSRLPSLRLLKLQDPALGMLDSAWWLALADMQHLAHLHLGGVRPLSGLGTLHAVVALRVLTVKMLSAADGLVEDLASGLAALRGCAITRPSLTLPEYGEPLDAALGCLIACRSLSLTITRPPAQGGAASRIRPARWAAMQLTQLTLNLAGDATHIEPGLSLLTGLQRLSVVGAAERSPTDLWAAGGHALQQLAFAGTGGLPPGVWNSSVEEQRLMLCSLGCLHAHVLCRLSFGAQSTAAAPCPALPRARAVPDCLDAQLPRLRSPEASYGALDDGLFPPALCTLGRQLTLVDLFNAGLENTHDCPATLPDAFSQVGRSQFAAGLRVEFSLALASRQRPACVLFLPAPRVNCLPQCHHPRRLPARLPLQLFALRQLSLAKNFLEVLPPPVLLLTNLTFLSLWGNRLEDLPPGGYLSRLQHLNLAANRLTHLPAAALSACGAGTLQKLGLASNPITQLCEGDARVLGRLASLQVLGLGELGAGQRCPGRAAGKCGSGAHESTGPGSDLEVALLWLVAAQVPRCSVSFDARQFTTRFA